MGLARALLAASQCCAAAPRAAQACMLPPMSFLAGVGAVRAKRPLPLAAKLALLLLALLYEAYYCNAEAKKKKKTKTTMTRRYFTILSTIKAKACLPHYIAAAMKLQLPLSRRRHTLYQPANTAYSLDCLGLCI